MGIAKSQVDKIVEIVVETLADAYGRLPKELVRLRDQTRDVAYIKQRADSEGITFLTTTLPKLGEWYDKLCQGVEVGRCDGFHPYNGTDPCFLRPFWAHARAMEMDASDAEIVRLVRTVLLGCKKLEIPYTDEQVATRLLNFCSIEQELGEQYLQPTSLLIRAAQLIEEFCAGFNWQCESPQHGPGAVAGGEKDVEKFVPTSFFPSLHAEFPYYDVFFGVRSAAYEPQEHTVRIRPLQLLHEIRTYKSMKIDVPTSRLLFVPKDSRGPRTICCEPKELMYVQQGLLRPLIRRIERHPLTKGHINFSDQTINGNLALVHSRERRLATIDLSDASDRVSLQLVRYLFPQEMYRKLVAARSTHVKLPNGEVLALEKFAPMGSALCFPIEALVFWSLCYAAVESLDLSPSDVYVYGDDIIVPNDAVQLVADLLDSVNLKVNRSKTFSGDNPFRESCGIDALNGHVVTPLRIRTLPPQRSFDGSGIVAYVDLAQNSQGFEHRQAAIVRQVEEIIRRRLPVVAAEEAFLSLVDPARAWDFSQYPDAQWSSDRCLYTSRQLVVSLKKDHRTPPPWFRLQRDLIEDFTDRDPSLVVARQATQIRMTRAPLWSVQGPKHK